MRHYRALRVVSCNAGALMLCAATATTVATATAATPQRTTTNDGVAPIIAPVGAPIDGGTAAAQLTYPAPGATGVVLEAALLVTLERTRLPSFAPRPAPAASPVLGEGLLLRDDTGAIVAGGPLTSLEAARPPVPTGTVADLRVEIATSPLELAPDTHYEVLSRISVCPGTDGARVACLADEYSVIGDFTTGTERDGTPPVITSVEVAAGPGECLLALSVTALDDHAEPEALRFRTSDRALLGTELVVLAPEPDAGGTRASLSLTPIDPSNNPGLTVVVEVDGCERPRVGVDDSPIDYFTDPPSSPPPPVTLPDRGCAIEARQGSPAYAAGWLGLALPVALGVALRLRRRSR